MNQLHNVLKAFKTYFTSIIEYFLNKSSAYYFLELLLLVFQVQNIATCYFTWFSASILFVILEFLSLKKICMKGKSTAPNFNSLLPELKFTYFSSFLDNSDVELPPHQNCSRFRVTNSYSPC